MSVDKNLRIETINLGVRVGLETLITKREGMLAENRQRSIEGGSMAYVDSDFIELGKRFKLIFNELEKAVHELNIL